MNEEIKTGQAARQAVVDALLRGEPHASLKRSCAIASAYALRDVPSDDSNAENRGNGSRAAKAITDGYAKLVEIASPDATEGRQQSETLREFVRDLGQARAVSDSAADAIIVAIGEEESASSGRQGVDWGAIQAQGLAGTSDAGGPLDRADARADAVAVVASVAGDGRPCGGLGRGVNHPTDLDNLAGIAVSVDRRACALSLRAKGVGRVKVRRHVRCGESTLRKWEQEEEHAQTLTTT